MANTKNMVALPLAFHESSAEAKLVNRDTSSYLSY